VTVQPITLVNIGRNPELRGRGLTARFLWALPQSMVGYRNVEAPEVPKSVREPYQRKVGQLIRSLVDLNDKVVVKLTPEALEQHFVWAQWVETNLGRGGKLANAVEWGNKLAGQTLVSLGIWSSTPWRRST
jgi:replicative DNA helicase